MEHQWRPIQHQQYPNSNICPTCCYSHFPFCPPYPPPPHPQQHRPDPYPPPYPPVPDNYYHNYNTEGDSDRSYKRPRVDPFNNRVPDWNHERRIKLIRDHGADVATFTGNHNRFIHDFPANLYSPFQPNNDTPPPSLYSHHHHQPPLPPTPPPPPPVEPPPPSLFPVPVGSNLSNSYLSNNEVLPLYCTALCCAFGFMWINVVELLKEWRPTGQVVAAKQHLSPEKAMAVDAACLFEQPYRATRPDRLVVILRGLPGSGKSYLAKRIRDLEVESGAVAPRIHSMDDYFMTEVEKVDESDGGKSSMRGKKTTVKRVMEYCYEPEMEEVYRESMLKAFKKTLEEGNFTFVIVDDRNLRVADFAQFWAIAKRSGYEAYLLEADYKDPAGCAARNVHGFTLDEVERMAGQWEEAPFLYLRLDIKSLFRGDDLKETGIQEVDMDAEDEEVGKDTSSLPERTPERTSTRPSEDDDSLALSKDEKRWNVDEDHPLEEVKELGKSKWSEDLDEDETEGSEDVRGNVNALSGLTKAYGKKQKSLHWSDHVGNRGFSISAAKKASTASLVIGPGSGYNLKSNPLPEEEGPGSAQSTSKSKKKKSAFQAQLRAERESFKLVFDRRRQRIGDLVIEEDS